MPTNTTTGSNAAIATVETVLKSIHQADINIAIYERNISQLQANIEEAIRGQISFNESGSIEEVMEALNAVIEDIGISISELVKDVYYQLQAFSEIIDSDRIKVLFSTVSSDMCRKFHTDVNYIRLLCTYEGPGTVWAPNEALEFSEDASSGRQRLRINEELIQYAGTGDIVLLKGALYANSRAVYHRSPVISEFGGTRLLLRVDKI